MSKKDIVRALNRVLVRGCEMDRKLYESAMEMYHEDWYESLIQDQEEYLIAILAEGGEVAMSMILRDKTIYVNEDAREKLKEKWKVNYEKNMRQLMPMMTDILAEGEIFVTGVSFI